VLVRTMVQRSARGTVNADNIPWTALADHASAGKTLDVGYALDLRAVLAGGLLITKGNNAAPAALKLDLSVKALVRPSTPARPDAAPSETGAADLDATLLEAAAVSWRWNATVPESRVA